jgi:hypothetical protein
MYRRILLVALLSGLWAIPVSAQTTFGPVGISAGGDDGSNSGTGWSAVAEFIGNDGAVNSIGLRWLNVTVPQGATITSATVILIPRNAVTGTITNVHGTWFGVDEDNVAQFSDGGIEALSGAFTPTTASTNFDPTTWVVDDPDDQTYDITSIVQEIVNRAGWSSGNAMALVLLDDSTANGNSARAWDFTDGNTPSSSSAGSKLTITYTAGAGGGGAAIGRNRRLLGVGR